MRDAVDDHPIPVRLVHPDGTDADSFRGDVGELLPIDPLNQRRGKRLFLAKEDADEMHWVTLLAMGQ